MIRELLCVRDFHNKMGIAERIRLPTTESLVLHGFADVFLQASTQLESQVANPDRRWISAHLLVEELGEIIKAMAKGDEAGTLDGLGDLIYIILGVAERFDLPISQAFHEIHRSNMSKERQPGDPGRVRDKGPNYFPPDIKGILREYRDV